MSRSFLKKTLAISIAVLLIIGSMWFIAVSEKKHEDPIKQMSVRYGFSLQGITTSIVASHEFPSFRDPCYVYVVRVTGGIHGSIFDADEMQVGFSTSAIEAIDFAETLFRYAGIEPAFSIDPETEYLSRCVWHNGSRLCIVLDREKDLYYIVNWL